MNASAIESDVVRNAARGSWLSVLDDLAPEIDKAIEKPGQRHIACPVHGGKDGFRLFRDANLSGGGCCNTCGPKPDGFSLLMWLRGWTFPEALSAIAGVLGLSSDSHQPQRIVHRKAHFDQCKSSINDDKIRALLRTVWQESKSIHHPDAEPVRLYLQSRGLDGWLPNWPSLRFHPKMQYRNEDNQVIGYFPAMLALVEKDNRAITIHRSFLTGDGRKAPVESPKKLMPVPADRLIVGSGIRLGNPGRVLSVTEGIETALSVIEATGMVTWPLISSTLMSHFIIPQGVEKLIIWSDLDRTHAGTFAAQKLAERAKTQGIQVEIREPSGSLPIDAKSIDWLDVLNQSGPNAFVFRSLS
ncbi:MAG: toprim domain-containing protein [Methylomicrobium sp.]|nr:toprim domain-containing protein [Methylomicrobium sp.]